MPQLLMDQEYCLTTLASVIILCLCYMIATLMLTCSIFLKAIMLTEIGGTNEHMYVCIHLKGA
jgi:hypothetical protein